MRRLGFFVFGFCFCTALFASENIRYVFKGSQKEFSAQSHLPLKKMSFGLTNEQSKQILELTQGQVDFSNTFYIDADESQKHLFSATSAEKIYPNILPPSSLQSTTADPSLKNEWWLDELKVPAAWNHATGQGVTIADCDAGFYHDEPDLYDNMLLNYRYDLSSRSPYVIDDGSMTSHGTAVAALMVGVLNGSGTNGIAYNAKLVPLQNFNYDSSLDTLDKEEATAKCVLKAIQTPGVQILVLENQMLQGSSEHFSGTRDAVRLAIKSGIIVVGAAGNYNVELTTEAQDDTGSIIVGALFINGDRIGYSNYGSRVTVGAFGVNLYTLVGPNGQMGTFGGTSGATPQVAATIALMKEVNPSLTPSEARRILKSTRSVKSANKSVGGQLNSEAAVLMAKRSNVFSAEFQESQEFRQKLVGILNN